MNMRLLTIGAAASLAIAVQGQAQDIVLQLGDDIAPQTIQAQAVDLFAEEVGKANVGITVEVFHGNQLGTGTQQIQNVKLGIQDMVNTGWELLDVFSPELRIGQTPFTFSDRDHFENWVRSPMFEKAHQEIIANGNQRIINLGEIWRRGPYRVMIANRPITTLEELSQIKMRVHESEVIKRYWGKDGLGATVVVLPLADVYLAFRQGVVDGFTMPFDLIVPMKWAEVGKHIMYTREAPQMVSLMINEDRWQSLNETQQQALLDAADTAGRFFNESIEKNLQAWQEELTAMGVEFHEIDRGPWIERIRERNMQWEADGYWRAGLIEEIDSLRKK